ncbi:MAG TPA: hypothetical protein VMR17_14310 [Xanthobacteraceae bacterium]|nr:hypothetical protein [Xanthobacteraceae bacterium]
MANSITIHSTVDGDNYALTLQKTGDGTGHAELQQVNPAGPSYGADLTTVHGNSTGSQLSCEANAFSVTIAVTCTVNSSPPSVHVVSSGFVPLNNTYPISQPDETALTTFIKSNFN